MSNWVSGVGAGVVMGQMLDLGNAMFRKRHPSVGASPGTLMIPEDSERPTIRVMSYDAEGLQETTIENTAELAQALEPGNITWVDVQGFGDEETIKKIGEVFSIHRVALEDIVNIPQRPKKETYDRQVLLVTRMVSVSDSGAIEMEQVSLLIGEHYVVSFQERHGDILDPVRSRLRSGNGPIRRLGSDYLAYAIADTIVDGYYPVIDAIGDHLELLESSVLLNPSSALLQDLNRTKNMLVNLRRAVWPQRESINSLIRDDDALITPDVRVYLRDTYDHCVQTAEVIEMYREMAAGLMNTYLSAVANRTNDVMKVLTIMASVFIPLTFLAGIYGMNFEHMPELHMQWAYPAVWCAMIATAGGMLCYFWRKGWLGG